MRRVIAALSVGLAIGLCVAFILMQQFVTSLDAGAAGNLRIACITIGVVGGSVVVGAAMPLLTLFRVEPMEALRLGG